MVRNPQNKVPVLMPDENRKKEGRMKKRYQTFRKASLIMGVVTLMLGLLPLTSLPGTSVIFADDTPPGPPVEIPVPGGPEKENTPEEPPVEDPLPSEPENILPPEEIPAEEPPAEKPPEEDPLKEEPLVEEPLVEEPLLMEMQISLLSASSSAHDDECPDRG